MADTPVRVGPSDVMDAGSMLARDAEKYQNSVLGHAIDGHTPAAAKPLSVSDCLTADYSPFRWVDNVEDATRRLEEPDDKHHHSS